MPAPTRGGGNNELTREIRALTAELAKSRQTAQRQTAQAVRDSGAGGGGGVVGARGKGGFVKTLAKVSGIASALAAIKGVDESLSAAVGFGTFRDGFGGAAAGGRAAGRAAIDIAANLPLVGGLTGASRTSEILDRTESRVLAITEGIARAGGPVGDDTRERLTRIFGEQERRVQTEREKVRDEVNSEVDVAGEGTLVGIIADGITKIVAILEQLGGPA